MSHVGLINISDQENNKYKYKYYEVTWNNEATLPGSTPGTGFPEM